MKIFIYSRVIDFDISGISKEGSVALLQQYEEREME